MGHAFLFFLCPLLIECTDHWYPVPSLGDALVIGSCIAHLARLRALRPDPPVLADTGPWPATSSGTFAAFVDLRMAALPCVVPRLIHWKSTTGSFLFHPYGAETFDFPRPYVVKGSTSTRVVGSCIRRLRWWPLWCCSVAAYRDLPAIHVDARLLIPAIHLHHLPLGPVVVRRRLPPPAHDRHARCSRDTLRTARAPVLHLERVGELGARCRAGRMHHP